MRTRVLVGSPALCLLILLSACSGDQRPSVIKRCIASATEEVRSNTAPSVLAAEDAEEHHDRIGDAVTDCMEEEGYVEDEQSMAAAECVDDVAFNPSCYRLQK